MVKRHPLLVELLTAIGLIVAPFVLPHLGFAPGTINRILVWGLFGIGFDILFGYTGLLSFGQSAFYGTGGFVAAYLLTQMGFPSVWVALIIGMVAAAVVGWLIGLIALRRTGIYFAMITVAIAEVFFFVEFSPLAAYTGGENGLPGVPTPTLYLGFTTIAFNTSLSLYAFLAFWYFVGMAIALRIVRSPVGAVLSAIRENPLRAAAVGHNIHGYKLTAFVIAAAYAGFAGGLLGVLQAFMPPDAFMFDTSGQLVMQTAIGGAGTLFGPLVGAALWLFLQDFLQSAGGFSMWWLLALILAGSLLTLFLRRYIVAAGGVLVAIWLLIFQRELLERAVEIGASWKLVLGLVFVLLICFLRRGIVGGLIDLAALVGGWSGAKAEAPAAAKAAAAGAAPHPTASAMPARRHALDGYNGPILQATGLTKLLRRPRRQQRHRFLGRARRAARHHRPERRRQDHLLPHADLRGAADRRQDRVRRARHHRQDRHRRLPSSASPRSYQVNQLFSRLTVRENSDDRGAGGAARQFPARHVPQHPVDPRPFRSGRAHARAGRPHGAPRHSRSRGNSPTARSAASRSASRSPSSPSLLLLDEPLAGMSPFWSGSRPSSCSSRSVAAAPW